MPGSDKSGERGGAIDTVWSILTQQMDVMDYGGDGLVDQRFGRFRESFTPRLTIRSIFQKRWHRIIPIPT